MVVVVVFVCWCVSYSELVQFPYFRVQTSSHDGETAETRKGRCFCRSSPPASFEWRTEVEVPLSLSLSVSSRLVPESRNAKLGLPLAARSFQTNSLSLCHTLIGGGNFLHFFFLLCEITNPFVCHIPRLSCAPKSGFSLSFPHHVGFRRWRWRPSGKASLRRRLTAKKRRPCTCLGRKPSSLRCSRRS